jgi:hypothetical protein
MKRPFAARRAKSRTGLREIPWGLSGDHDGVCIYDNGHIDPAEFLARVQAWTGSDVPAENRAELTVDCVIHTRFRPMSPAEADQFGFTQGVIKTNVGGYLVTAVIF